LKLIKVYLSTSHNLNLSEKSTRFLVLIPNNVHISAPLAYLSGLKYVTFFETKALGPIRTENAVSGSGDGVYKASS
jgi:hypothetical protein